MAILPLITSPNPLLKQISQPVAEFDAKLQQFMDDMIETMYDSAGVGLAAVQVGVLKRVLVMDVEYELKGCDGNHNDKNHSHFANQKPLFLVNPEIIHSSKETSSYQEGCLSFPEIRAEITRPKEVKVKYLDYNGKEQILEADGLLSTCVQHEIDHLNGITFVDYLSKIKRDMLLKKMKKLAIK